MLDRGNQQKPRPVTLPVSFIVGLRSLTPAASTLSHSIELPNSQPLLKDLVLLQQSSLQDKN